MFVYYSHGDSSKTGSLMRSGHCGASLVMSIHSMQLKPPLGYPLYLDNGMVDQQAKCEDMTDSLGAEVSSLRQLHLCSNPCRQLSNPY